MKAIVNPFEPWRPIDLPIPTPLNAGRPWRPSPPLRPASEEAIPLAESVDPPARKRKQRCCGKKKCAARKAKKTQPSIDRERVGEPKRSRILPILFLLLGTLILAGFSCFGGTHYFRVFVTLFAVFVGFSFGLSPSAEKSWHVRLRWMTCGLALAGLSAWFVPTLSGINLWSAYRQVEDLREMQPGEVDEFLRGAADRHRLVEAFPSFAAEVKSGEAAWLRRTVDEAISSADLRLDTLPCTAATDLQKLSAELKGLDHFDAVRDELQSAIQRAEQACVKADRRR